MQNSFWLNVCLPAAYSSMLGLSIFEHRQEWQKEEKGVWEVSASVCWYKMKDLRVSHNVNWFRRARHYSLRKAAILNYSVPESNTSFVIVIISLCVFHNIVCGLAAHTPTRKALGVCVLLCVCYKKTILPLQI